MQKNTASQKLIVYVFDSTTNLPKTGDAANLTAYVSKDFGSVTALGDTSATEMDATNAKGFYLFDLTQGETNADILHFTCKSTTANMVALASPATVATVPASFSAFVTPTDASVSVGKWSGTTVASPDTAGYPKVTVKVGTGTGELNISSGAVPTTGNVKKNTALAKFMFMMTDSTGHAPATGKTVTCTRSIDGAAFASGTLGTPTEVANGIYYVDFAAADLNGNNIILRATATSCDDTFERIVTSL